MLVLTDYQIAGRGQRGNVWEAQPGQNLMFSFLLKPTFLSPAEQFWINIAVSLGVYDTLQPLVGESLRIKWPNDVYAHDLKLGGILIENTLQSAQIAWSVVGIGLNVNQTMFGYATATSLQQQAPLPNSYDRTGLLSLLCENIEKRYLQLRAGQRDLLKSNYLQILYRYQEQHLFKREGLPFWGTIIGIDPTGRLAIQEGSQVQYFGFKEIEFITSE